ncbi:MAG TPA: MOSC N-terminal beta barrel domain-containing protein [Chitinophagaceae bacterium]|nr:MOSC N-terminal beta barrel domain-containing protein [Chitinophagaceae bacterium]
MLQVSQLFVYPIKSLGGISLTSAAVTDRGLQYDRRWMLVDDGGQFMTQRTISGMALLGTELTPDGIRVYHKESKAEVLIPFETSGPTVMVQVWSSRCKAIIVDETINGFFSDVLSKSCKLVFMPPSTNRRVDGRYASNKETTTFTDGYPFLLIGQSSLDDLNSRLEEKLPINRFRPSIVFTGGTPYEEDTMARFSINTIEFFGVKLCARCIVTTINQDNATKSKEPLNTLSSYRKVNNKIYFGQNLLHRGEGIISVGDTIHVEEKKAARVPLNIR